MYTINVSPCLGHYSFPVICSCATKFISICSTLILIDKCWHLFGVKSPLKCDQLQSVASALMSVDPMTRTCVSRESRIAGLSEVIGGVCRRASVEMSPSLVKVGCRGREDVIQMSGWQGRNDRQVFRVTWRSGTRDGTGVARLDTQTTAGGRSRRPAAENATGIFRVVVHPAHPLSGGTESGSIKQRVQ